MKKIILILALLISVGIYNSKVDAQINISININHQPAWGPIGYDYAPYYYFPDLNVYYDIDNGLFYYRQSRRWVANQYLPYKYRQYDLYMLYKVVLYENSPWLYNKQHKKYYSGFRGDRTQMSIRYSNDNRYHYSQNNLHIWTNPADRPGMGGNSGTGNRPNTGNTGGNSGTGNRPNTGNSGGNSGTGNRPNTGNPGNSGTGNRPNTGSGVSTRPESNSGGTTRPVTNTNKGNGSSGTRPGNSNNRTR